MNKNKRPLLVIRDPFPVAYRKALEEQMERVNRIIEDAESPYILHFLEHEPVYTTGRSFDKSHLLFSEEELKKRGIHIEEIARGGSITYHAPGQLVVYLHVSLKELQINFHRLFRELEDWVLDFLRARGLTAERAEGMTGAWVDGAKICAMGIGAKKFVTFHGISININPDLTPFSWVVPCGLTNRPVTSLKALNSHPLEREDIEDELLKNLPPFLRELERV